MHYGVSVFYIWETACVIVLGWRLYEGCHSTYPLHVCDDFVMAYIIKKQLSNSYCLIQATTWKSHFLQLGVSCCKFINDSILGILSWLFGSAYILCPGNITQLFWLICCVYLGFTFNQVLSFSSLTGSKCPSWRNRVMEHEDGNVNGFIAQILVAFFSQKNI